jgi:hypothetical protein
MAGAVMALEEESGAEDHGGDSDDGDAAVGRATTLLARAKSSTPLTIEEKELLTSAIAANGQKPLSAKRLAVVARLSARELTRLPKKGLLACDRSLVWCLARMKAERSSSSSSTSSSSSAAAASKPRVPRAKATMIAGEW